MILVPALLAFACSFPQGAARPRMFRQQKAPQQAPPATPEEVGGAADPIPTEPTILPIEELGHQVLRAWTLRMPWLADRVLEEWDPELAGSWGMLARTRDNDWPRFLKETTSRLHRSESAAGGSQVDPDVKWLLAWLAIEELLTWSHPPERQDPVWTLESIISGLREHIADEHALDAARFTALQSRLEGLPHVLEVARTNWTRPLRPLLAPARARADELLRTIEVELPRAMERATPEIADAPARIRFDEAHGRALAETRELLDWMDVKLSKRATDEIQLDAESWESLIGLASGIERPVSELKVALLRDISELGILMRNQLELRAPKEVPRPERAVVDGAHWAKDVGQTLGILTSGTAKIDPRLRPANGPPGELVEVRCTGQRAVELRIELAGEDWSEALRGTRSSLLSGPALEAIGVRYGSAGEALARVLAQERGSSFSRGIPNHATIDGWGLFTTEWVLRSAESSGAAAAAEGDAGEGGETAEALDREVLSELRRQRLLAAARLVASLEIFHERRTVADVADRFQRFSGLDAESSLVEVLAVLRDPLAPLGYLAYLELHGAELALRSAHGDSSLGLVAAEVFARPQVRIGEIRRFLERASPASFAKD